MEERRTISELVTLYELEPSVRDIYVEGPTDRAFIVGVIRRVGLRNVQIREVDLINVAATQLQELGLGTGCRQRVVAAAIMLERIATKDLSSQVVFIADADEEAGARPRISGSLLLYTDVSSMTTYAFNAQYIQWYFDVEVLGFPLSGEQVICALAPVLREASVLRRASSQLGYQVAMVDVTSDCELAGPNIEFDKARFFLRYINKARAHHMLKKMETLCELHGTSLCADPRLWVDGEDFILLLHWLILQARGAANTVARHLLGRTLLLGIPIEDIKTWPMFAEIFARFG